MFLAYLTNHGRVLRLGGHAQHSAHPLRRNRLVATFVLPSRLLLFPFVRIMIRQAGTAPQTGKIRDRNCMGRAPAVSRRDHCCPQLSHCVLLRSRVSTTTAPMSNHNGPNDASASPAEGREPCDNNSVPGRQGPFRRASPYTTIGCRKLNSDHRRSTPHGTLAGGSNVGKETQERKNRALWANPIQLADGVAQVREVAEDPFFARPTSASGTAANPDSRRRRPATAPGQGSHPEIPIWQAIAPVPHLGLISSGLGGGGGPGPLTISSGIRPEANDLVGVTDETTRYLSSLDIPELLHFLFLPLGRRPGGLNPANRKFYNVHPGAGRGPYNQTPHSRPSPTCVWRSCVLP